MSIKRYIGPFGLNKMTTFNVAAASIAQNCQNRIDNHLQKRRGYQIKLQNVGGYGAGLYTYVDGENALVNNKLLFDTTLHKIQSGNLTIEYTGSFSHTNLYFILADGAFNCSLVENNVTILDSDVGIGLLESSPTTILNLSTLINAESGFATSVTGEATTPAAFLDVEPNGYILNGQAYAWTFFYSEAVKSTLDDMLTIQSNSTMLRNCQGINYNNQYILLDGTQPKVYDDQRLHLAGLPSPILISSAYVNSGGLTGEYTYYLSYSFTNARGKRTESALSDPIIKNPSAQDVELTIDTLGLLSGYNVMSAMAAGAQSDLTPNGGNVTIAVDDGAGGAHSLQVGDTAYFFNSHMSVNDYVTYKITAITSSSISVQTSDQVSLVDNAPISANFQINIYRVGPNSATLYLLASIPHNTNVASQVYTDADPSTTPGPSIDFPDYIPGIPPAADCGTVYKNALVLGKGSFIYWGDITAINLDNTAGLNFPAENVLPVETKITALAALGNYLYVFGTDKVYGISGQAMDLQLINYALLSSRVGCVSQHGLVTIGGILFFLDRTGIYGLQDGQLILDANGITPRNFAAELGNFFEELTLTGGEQYSLERTVAAYNREKKQVYFSIPAETSSIDYATNNTLTLMWDLKNGKWFTWTNWDGIGGMFQEANGDFWCTSRRASPSAHTRTYRSLSTNTLNDVNDHHVAISAVYRSCWDAFNEGSILDYKALQYFVVNCPQHFLLDTEIQPTYTCTIFRDAVPNLLHSEFNLDFSTALGGLQWPATLNDQPLGQWQLSSLEQRLSGISVTSAQFQIQNAEESTDINVHSFEYVWAIKNNKG